MYKIVTHPGSAHKDDFLAACVLIATLDNAEIYRREPTRADLDDPATYVVDVGMEHDPARRNFDHHQDRSLPCAFHLVMRYLGYHDAAKLVFAWYPHMSMFDVRGPYRTAEYLGVKSSVFSATSSPIDGYVLATFAGIEFLNNHDPLFAFMKELGRDMLAMIDRKMMRLDRLKSEARVIPVRHLKAVISDIDDTPKLAMELYLQFLDDADIVMSITPSNRGEGWELLRLGDNTIVDFRAIAEHPQIRFVHGSGFMAKTHIRLPLQKVVELAALAVTAM